MPSVYRRLSKKPLTRALHFDLLRAGGTADELEGYRCVFGLDREHADFGHRRVGYFGFFATPEQSSKRKEGRDPVKCAVAAHGGARNALLLDHWFSPILWLMHS